MRRILSHRKATAYLRRMPPQRREQMMAALEEVAGLEDLSTHPGIRNMKGARSDWYRLRVGSYRAVLRPEKRDGEDVLYVSYIGPRGDVY